MAAGYYALCVPKIGHASPAEINAALPASLKVVDPPDPAGEERYRRLGLLAGKTDRSDLDRSSSHFYSNPPSQLIAQVVSKNEARLVLVAALLQEGGLRVPTRSFDVPSPEGYGLRKLGMVIGFAIENSAHTDYQAECLRECLFGLRYSEMVLDAGGTVSDEVGAIAIQRSMLTSIYRAEMSGGLSSEGRSTIQRALDNLAEPPSFVDAIRRQFWADQRPFLFDTDRAFRAAFERGRSDWPIGSFAPVATAKLMGEICEASMRDAERPLDRQSGDGRRLADEAVQWVPRGYLGRYDFGERCAMNALPNTLGRSLAADCGFNELARVKAGREASIALLKAVFALRTGGKPNLTDPLGKGKLRIDPSQRLVWSVGENEVDDGGVIERSGATNSPDFGYSY